MFGLQAPSIKQKLRDFAPGLADALAGLFGDCEQELEHSGPVTLAGPTALAGPTTLKDELSNADGDALLTQNGAKYLNLATGVGHIGDYYLDYGNFTNTPTIPAAVTLWYMKTATLGSDLNAGGTATVDGVTATATFIRSGYKLTSGTVVGAIPSAANTWHIIAWNTCEVVQ